MSRIIDTYDPRTGRRTDYERPYDNRAYMSSDERYAYDDRHDYTRYTGAYGNGQAERYSDRGYHDDRRYEDRRYDDRRYSDRPERRDANYYNDRCGSGYKSNAPALLMIFGSMYVLGGLALIVLGALAFLPLMLAGAGSVVVGLGYIKGWKMMWYVGVVAAAALAALAAYLMFGVANIPMLGFFFTPFAGAGIVCNIVPMIYLFLPKVRAYFGV